jgi:hypothetical protein
MRRIPIITQYVNISEHWKIRNGRATKLGQKLNISRQHPSPINISEKSKVLL